VRIYVGSAHRRVIRVKSHAISRALDRDQKLARERS
jgi:hypothetical protein